MLIICGPSGVGKSTLAQALLDRRPSATMCVSHTTRPPRNTDIDKQTYHFVDKETFDRMARDNEFAERAFIHGHHYGTSFSEIQKVWDTDQSIVFDIDYQGAEQLRMNFPEAVSVIIVPPTINDLKKRLEERNTEPKEVIEERIRGAKDELSQWQSFSYYLTNDNLDEAIENLIKIYDVAEMRTSLNFHVLNELFPPNSH